MLKSVHTFRLSTPQSSSSGSPSGASAMVQNAFKRLSRASSSSSSSQTLNRLSLAPEDSALSLPIALSPQRPPVQTHVVTSLKGPESSDDHLYEEIYSAVYSNNQPSPTQTAPGTAIPSPDDPPKLAPVSGVLCSKSAAVIRPIAFKPYVRSTADVRPAPIVLTKPALSPSYSAPVATNSLRSETQASATARKPTGRSLSDPWKGTGYRKAIAPVTGPSASGVKSWSTPSSILEDLGQHVYYPSSSDKSGSYGYVSCSDQSAESIYGTHKTYHARMIRTDDDETFSFDDSYHVTATPSPSDSGIAINYEALLREKDGEILALRNTMEHNEGVIFKVHEEKESAWRKQSEAMKEYYEMQLRKLSLDHDSRQEDLSLTVDQLRQQNLKLHQQVQTAMECKSSMEESIRQLEAKCQETEARLDEANWTVCEKTGQISLLKKMRSNERDNENMCQQVVQLQQKLDSAQKEALQRNVELKDLRQTLNFLSQELFQVQQKFDGAREELEQNQDPRKKRASLAGENSEVEKLRRELLELKLKSAAEKKAVDEERVTWLEEKEKVIKYQKQLQLSYLEIYKRNCSLETELDDINVSLRINDMLEQADSVRESDC